MSDAPPPSSFRMRRLAAGETPKPPAQPARPPAAPPAPPRAPAPDAHTVAVFPGAAAALACLGQLAGAGLTDGFEARRAPDGRCRLAVSVPPGLAAPPVLAAGGRVAPAEGAGWPAVALAELLASVGLLPAARLEASEAMVLTGAALGPMILRRAAAAGLSVELVPAERAPLAGGEAQPAVLLRLRWRGTAPPRTLLLALARLPDTVVARPAAAAEPGAALAGLLIDLRCQLPAAAALLGGLVPAGEAWLLAAADAGAWRILPRGPALDGLALLAPDRLAIAPPLTPDDTALPGAIPLPVALVPDPGSAAGAADAVLLDDADLAWTRRFLMARPATAETAFLLPGPGRHLLLAPGGLLERLPFGVALRRVGAEPLLLEQGQRFHPPLPAAARARLLGAGEGEVVAVARTGGGALFAGRFALAAARPAWLLWLAEPPPVAAGLAGAAAERLAALAARIDRERPQPEPEGGRRLPLLRRWLRRAEGRDDLLRRALALEAAGRLVAAAELLEQAGEPVRAARLYERAAGEPR